MHQKLCTHFGLLLLLQLGAVATEFVTVNRDIKMKLLENEDVNVTLDCVGSRADLNYYIKNKLTWTFIPSIGRELTLAERFYSSPDASRLFVGSEARYKYSYRPVDSGYGFYISIKNVTRQDSGTYRCSLWDGDEESTLIDSKEVKITVVNPVENVTMELVDAGQNVIAKSTSPVSTDAVLNKITPGEYTVTCTAYGSNPEPVMNLFLNEQKPYVSVYTEKSNSTEFESYIGAFEVRNLTIHEHAAVQALVCKANIEGDFYASEEAGIALLVHGSKPKFECDYATASLNDEHFKIRCNITDTEDRTHLLKCENVSWLLGNMGHKIGYEQTSNDQKDKYGILQSTCEQTKEGLIVTLDIFSVTVSVFKETFFLIYGTGETLHKLPVKVHEATITTTIKPEPNTAASGYIPAIFPALICSLFAFVLTNGCTNVLLL